MLSVIVILAGLMLLNGVFAMAELAMMTSRQSRLQQAAKNGSRGAAAALKLARDPTRFLSTVQVGITLIGVLAGAYGESALSGYLVPIVGRLPWLAPYAESVTLVVVVIALTYFSLVVGELVPKRIALAHPELIAAGIARPLWLLSKLTSWPVKLLTLSTDLILKVLFIESRSTDDVSEDDVRALISRAASTGIFTPQELKLFDRTMRAGDLIVRDLMVARPDIVWIDESEPMEEVRRIVASNPHSHFPVCRGSLDDLVGVIHIKDLIARGFLTGADFPVTAVAQKALFVPETMPALRLLDQFKASRNHFAFVVDEYGGTQGMLTLYDVTRAIVGDVSRVGDPSRATMRRRSDREWLVDGRLGIHELVVGLELPEELEDSLPGVVTVAGVVTNTLGRIPVEGEKFEWQGFTIEIIDMDGPRVDKVMVTRPEVPLAKDQPEGG